MQAVRYPGIDPKPDFEYGTVRNHDFSSSGQIMIWRDIETSKGVYNWTGPDIFVNGNAADGVDQIWTFMGSPDWAVAAAAVGGAAYGGKSNMPPDNDVDWTDHITAVVNRYKASVKFWQCWNEPNLALYYAGAAATPSRMAVMQRLLYQTVKALDPSATVLSPPYTSVFSGIAGLNAFLPASDGIGGTAKDWFDVMTYHYYCNDYSNRPSGLYRMHLGVLAAMAAVGINKPVWATETGLLLPPFTSFSQDEQNRLERIYVLTLLALGLERFLWYQIGNVNMGFGAEGNAVWDEIANQCIGRSIVYSEVSMLNRITLQAVVKLSDGVTLTDTYGPMPLT